MAPRIEPLLSSPPLFPEATVKREVDLQLRACVE